METHGCIGWRAEDGRLTLRTSTQAGRASQPERGVSPASPVQPITAIAVIATVTRTAAGTFPAR